MKIWAHRGCCLRYPENTLLAFEKAAELDGLTGIELDIQLTKDNEMVVMHNETVDKTTDGNGYIKDFTLSELKKLKIASVNDNFEQIPTIDEVFDLLQDKLKKGLLLNIELKNSSIRYEGMEKKILELVHKRGLSESVVYSSFNINSVRMIKDMDPKSKTGFLGKYVSTLYYMNKDYMSDKAFSENALHPFWKGIDMPAEMLKGYTVRAYGGGRFFPEQSSGIKLDLSILEEQGITDIFLNEPEMYL